MLIYTLDQSVEEVERTKQFALEVVDLLKHNPQCRLPFMLIYTSDQSLEEVERTKQFALEVVDLLKHNPQCRMPFNKFIPAYHHHFGRQCRVSDYGFTKLVDLFDSIPQVVEVQKHVQFDFTKLKLLKGKVSVGSFSCQLAHMRHYVNSLMLIFVPEWKKKIMLYYLT